MVLQAFSPHVGHTPNAITRVMVKDAIRQHVAPTILRVDYRDLSSKQHAQNRPYQKNNCH